MYGHDTRAEIIGSNGRIQIGPNFQNTVVIANENGYKTSDKFLPHIERYKAFLNDVSNKRNNIYTSNKY